MSSWKRYAPLAALAVVSLGLVAVQNRALAQGRLDPIAGAGTALLSPFQRGLNGMGAYLSDVANVVFRHGDLASQNAQLRAQLTDVQGQNERLSQLQHENAELRALLQMPKPLAGRNLAVDVIAASRGDFSRRLTLGAGSRAGVRAKDVVFCAQGLVGQVSAVGPLTSVVTPLLDRDGGVGAFVARTGVQGLVVGDGTDTPKMLYLPFDADVRVGDLLLSSGAGQQEGAIYPRGLVVGRVLKTEKDRAFSRQNAFVVPAVVPENLGAAWVHLSGAS